MLHMNPTRGDKRMNPRPLSILYGLPSRLNIPLITPRQPTNYGHIPTLSIDSIAHLFGYRPHRLEVFLGRRWEPGFNDVDSKFGQLTRDVELLLRGEGGAGGLLAVAESGVEHAHVVRVGDSVRDVFGAGGGDAGIERGRRLLEGA